MRLQLAQIGGMALYEFKMHWRRRALLIAPLAMLVFNALGFALIRQEIIDATPLFDEGDIVDFIVPGSWAGIYITLLALLPVIVSDTIPKDKHFGVRNLLNSLPLSSGTYLLGKLVGMWVSALFGLFIAMLASLLVLWMVIGSFYPREFLGPWLSGAIPFVMMNCGLSVLLAAWAGSRRSAIAVGMVFAVFCIFLFGLEFVAIDAGKGPDFWFNFNPARPAMYWYFGSFHDLQGAAGLSVSITEGDYWQTIGFGSLQLIAVWSLLWVWLRWRDGKA